MMELFTLILQINLIMGSSLKLFIHSIKYNIWIESVRLLKINSIKEISIGCNQGCTSCIEKCPFDQRGYTHIKNRFDKMDSMLKSKNKI